STPLTTASPRYAGQADRKGTGRTEPRAKNSIAAPPSSDRKPAKSIGGQSSSPVLIAANVDPQGEEEEHDRCCGTGTEHPPSMGAVVFRYAPLPRRWVVTHRRAEQLRLPRLGQRRATRHLRWPAGRHRGACRCPGPAPRSTTCTSAGSV